MTHKWRHGNTPMFRDVHTHATQTHIHTTRPEEGWGWWQSLSLSQCQYLSRNEAQCPLVTHSLSAQSDINDPLSFPDSTSSSSALHLLSLYICSYLPLILSASQPRSVFLGAPLELFIQTRCKGRESIREINTKWAMKAAWRHFHWPEQVTQCSLQSGYVSLFFQKKNN